MHTLYDNTAQGLISDDGLSTKHHILNMLRVQLSQDEEQTLGFEEVNESMAEDIITELDRMERIPKRITYNSHLNTLRVVTIPHKVHEAHLPWLIDAIKMYPQPLEFHERKQLRILASPSKHLYSLLLSTIYAYMLLTA